MMFPIESRATSSTPPRTLPSSPEPQGSMPDLMAPADRDYLSGPELADQAPHAPVTGLGLRTPHAAAAHRAATMSSQAPALHSNLPTGRALTRHDFQNPDLVRYFGAAMGKLHQSNVSDAHAETPLRLIKDVEGRMGNVEANEAKRRACKIDIDSAKTLVAALSRDLQAAAKSRVYGDFNSYPEALQIDGEGGYTNTPDDKITGWHADFEILARLSYTARIDHVGLDTMLDAYYGARDGKSVTLEQRDAAFKAKYLFDILYSFYFVDIAFNEPKVGTEAAWGNRKCLEQADLLRSRLLEDAQSNVGSTLPALQFLDT